MALPRIAPEELERLKMEIPIQRLAEARGIKLKSQGKDPSLTVAVIFD